MIKKSGHEILNYMNVIFEKKQNIEVGSVLDWELDGLILPVFVTGETNLNVKGKLVTAYAVGIIDDDNKEKVQCQD